jgi:hypothetical protein
MICSAAEILEIFVEASRLGRRSDREYLHAGLSVANRKGWNRDVNGGLGSAQLGVLQAMASGLSLYRAGTRLSIASGSIARAARSLRALGFLDNGNRLTPAGWRRLTS